MMYLPCPHCGNRNADEFIYGGDTSRQRPVNPGKLSNQSWCEHIYTVPNVKGVANEFWWHKRGCNHWITLQRDSRNDDVKPLAGEASHD